MADDIVSYTWHEIIAWGVFFLIIGAVGITAWYFLKDTPIGQTFGDIFGAINAVLAAVDKQITTCLTVGLFGPGCTLGWWGLGAIGVAVVFGAVKWLFGPAIETNFGRLWKAAKGTDVSNKDIQDMNDRVDSAVAKSRSTDPDLWKDIPPGSPAEMFVRRIIANIFTSKDIQTSINSNPAVENKVELTTENTNVLAAKNAEVKQDANDNDNDGEVVEATAETAAEGGI